MKKIIAFFSVLFIFFSCHTKNNFGKFMVTGQLKNVPNQKVFLEQLSFVQNDPEILDTTEIKNGKFLLTALAPEEGIYRIRLEKAASGFLFINDIKTINFTADLNDVSLTGPSFASPANFSLKKFIAFHDSLAKILQEANAAITQLKQNNITPTDSLFVNAQSNFVVAQNALTAFCFKYADTTQSPALALFATTAAPVEMEKFAIPLQKLQQRFASHKGILAVANFAKQQIAAQQQQQLAKLSSPAIGSMAPNIIMPDVNDKPFGLSQLKGKYVLIDFWASWCGPCRAENPNVVAAYNKFKNKNFTVLGVSLDRDKASWLKAIADDKLSWQHISDLKFWNSAAVALYGFDGIPYNVLINPEGKIIATSLRGEELMEKLKQVLN